MVLNLEEWLALPRTEIAAYLQNRHVAVLFCIDGTRRHYLLSTGRQKIDSFTDYCQHSANSYVRVYDMLYGLGVETILTPLLYPPNFARDERYLSQVLDMCKLMLVDPPFTDLYDRWRLRARLYGDWDIAPNAAKNRTEISEVAASLANMTPDGERRLLFGYCAGSFSEEMIARSIALYKETGETPSEAALKSACFPDGPERLNFRISAGWLRVGMTLPTLLDGGKTDLYNLAHLALDVQEETLRRILYDYLFRRWVGPEDDAAYTPEDLRELHTYYDEHRNCVIGLGQLVGPGLWHADHAH